MTIRLQEVVRSEVEGGLSGPANPIPSQSIDCGCGQLPCPKLAKFATRKLFVGLMSWIGLVQAAAFAYFHIAGPTIARRFQFDPYLMNWILMISGLTPFVLGVLIAYWGNKIHRVAWVGSLVLLQSISFFVMIIPHLTHDVRVIEETSNLMHMSLYADESPVLCSAASSRLVTGEYEPCYFSLTVVIGVQIITGMANIAYFALGISYLDDNTKKRHVGAFLGVVLAVKLLGLLLGYVLAWGCLRIDAETFEPVGSYREQIGAWWLGFPILAVLLVIPGLLLSWFPKMLPSEVVEQAAASLLNSRVPRATNFNKDSSRNLFPSLRRLFGNKILLCNILASALTASALVNFMTYENVILESRFHVPRPTGLLLGFADPMYSRLASSILKPILISLFIIISGLVIAKARPNARYIIGFNLVMIVLTATIIFSMIFVVCNRRPIVDMDSKGSIILLQYCNKDCGCSPDADFRPVCDSSGMHTFYSPCHAGCTSSDYTDGFTKYSGCSCVERMAGKGNQNAVEGPCGSSQCQIGWLVFEFGTMFAYALIASTFTGDLLITLRCVPRQDKAISVGFWMMWIAFFIVPGKVLYESIANLTCLYWGSQKTFCRLHDSPYLGDYLSYLTAGLLLLALLVKIIVWFFCNNLKLYVETEDKGGMETEMREVARIVAPENESNLPATENNNTGTQLAVVADVESPREATTIEPDENPRKVEEGKQERSEPLKYGPLGVGDRRTDAKPAPAEPGQRRRSMIRNLDSEDDLSSSDEDCRKDSSPKVAYKPLDLDSDVESDLSSIEPRSRKRILSRDYDRVRTDDDDESSKRRSQSKRFPNPDDYGDPRENRHKSQNGYTDGSSKTSSFEFAKNGLWKKTQNKGDFNEVGIPIRPVDPPVPPSALTADKASYLKDVKSLIDRYEQNAERNEQDEDGVSVRSMEEKNRTEGKVVSGIPLVAMVQKKSSSSRGQSPSGMSNSSGSVGAFTDARSESRASNSSKNSGKTGKGSLCTDL